MTDATLADLAGDDRVEVVERGVALHDAAGRLRPFAG